MYNNVIIDQFTTSYYISLESQTEPAVAFFLF